MAPSELTKLKERGIKYEGDGSNPIFHKEFKTMNFLSFGCNY